MNKKVEIINEVLYQADLMGLCEFDCNTDEYLPEAQQFAEFIDNDNPNQEDLSMYIQQVFVRYFETVVDFEDCEMVAECILKNLEAF
jgi:hypothetical protein